MCDTMVALPPATAAGHVLFAKNSDRERNEAQVLEMFPRASHAPGTRLACTYIEIPQVAQTHAVLLSRPFWIWGAEMGANEHGVVIGNEAVYAASPPPSRTRALIGMDLLRLALERSTSAAEAVDVITGLLEAHGQGGSCGHLEERFYDNSFIVADAREAFVVETIGRMWAVERCPPVRAISNALSIGRGAIHAAGGGLLEHARAQGWAADLADLDLGACLDEARDAVSRGRLRCSRATTLLRRREGRLTPADMMATLRDHGPEGEADAAWHPERMVGRTICMHAADPARGGGQSVGSMVAEIAPGRLLLWVTGTAAPCLSVFKPVLLEAGLPAHGPRPTDRADAASLWWRHERLHRAAVLGDFAGVLADVAPERDRLEAAFAQRMAAILQEGGDASRAVAECWAEADAAERRWTALTARPGHRPDAAFTASWTALEHHPGRAA